MRAHRLVLQPCAATFVSHNGLPKTAMARIGVQVAQSSPETIYLVTEFEGGGTLYRSDDKERTYREGQLHPGFLGFRERPTRQCSRHCWYELGSRQPHSLDARPRWRTCLLNPMMGHWSSADEALLVENLELGHDLELICEVLERAPSDIVLRMVHLYQNGSIVVMAGATFDVLVKRIGE